MKWQILTMVAALALAGAKAAMGVDRTAARSDVSNYPSLVVDFTKGGTELTADAKREISSFINNARGTHKINEVYVAVWGDMRRSGDKSLSDDQQDLARQRSKKLETYLEDELKVDADTFNMAKRTDLWGRIFDTEEARVKGQKPAGHDMIAQVIRDQGKPSSAVLVIESEAVAD